MKVGAIGTGTGRSTAGYAMVMSGAANEIGLVDMNAARAEAEARDMAHAVPIAHPTVVRSGGEHGVCELMDRLGAGQSRMSRHR